MTKKIAISIPDDVAERLAAGDIDNVSAYVTEAVRRQIEVEQTRKMVADSGISVTEEGIERWRRILAERKAQVGPEDWQAARDHLDRITRGGEPI
jgi:post-segregation antitoxin (ccd killing protein)